MKHCRYNINNKCSNPSSLFEGFSSEMFCPVCTADDEYKSCDCRWSYGVGKCGYTLPDTVSDCNGVCKLFEEAKEELIEEQEKEMEDTKIVIEGVGKDAEVVTNANGGKQSKSPMAMHLIDPNFLRVIIGSVFTKEKPPITGTIMRIAHFMVSNDVNILKDAAMYLVKDSFNAIITIAKVLQEGAEKYEANNWRLIPQEEHINHALIHLMAALMGDTQDDHIEHALTRIMMAYATEKSEGFSYTEYIKKAA